MIKLAQDCLIIHSSSGEGMPCIPGATITVELSAEMVSSFDAEFIKHAASAVLHYFRDELGRQSVSMAEFTLALENVLRGFKVAEAINAGADTPAPRVIQADLGRIVAESNGGELVFFPRLRDELRSLLSQSPQMLCFGGIRHCVKQLAGAQRWSQRCQTLHDQIVEFLRSCMSCEKTTNACSLIVR